MEAEPAPVPNERAKRYRKLANEADREAAKRTGTLSKGYHELEKNGASLLSMWKRMVIASAR